MTATEPTPGRYALISVSDKTGVTDFAAFLAQAGFTILSTGGTAARLREAGVPVTGVTGHTGFPEIMDGRVKTLHPRIHGGLLGRSQDTGVMAEHDIPPIDVLVVNLYPFEAATADPACTLEDAVENIDIGGPAMLRAAAKNHARVAAIVDPADYGRVREEIAAAGEVGARTRHELAVKAFAHTARYDGMVAAWLSSRDEAGERTATLPVVLTPQFRQVQALRYGENPHQRAAFYADAGTKPVGIAGARQLQGKALSFNNINDADAALACVRQFTDEAACVIVKHANPCGVAVGDGPGQAYERAFLTDPVSAFGGIIAFNRELDEETAAAIVERQFVEVVLAPAVSDGARDRLTAKPNVRVLEASLAAPADGTLDLRRVSGGLLVQDLDLAGIGREDCRCVTERAPDEAEWADLLFAWRVAHMVKSNAIVYAAGGRTLGIGAGQMSRVDSARIARWKAGDAELDLAGAAMASDAFFPFRDGIDTAAEAGVRCVIQPGGSMRDEEVIAAADEHGIAMVFTGVRHFRH